MHSNNYRFIDLHISSWVKYFSVGIIATVLLFIFFQLAMWIIPMGFLIIFITVISLKSSKIETVNGLNKPSIVIRNASKTIQLQTPIEANVWWNYSFKGNMTDFNDGRPHSGPSANDINVMFEITDGDNQKVTFVEKIIFGSRFPNEANYSQDKIDENSAQFKIQRVDKLIEFLHDYLLE